MQEKVCFVSVDVEPDFGQQEFQGIESFDQILDIFKRVDVKATFFTTGKVLEKYGERFKQLANQSFEIAGHSYSHIFWNKLTEKEREQDTDKFLSIYNQLFNKTPLGFRAPSHIIDNQGLKLLQNKGFLYDSSVVPHYPPFKKYRGFRGKAPNVPYLPSESDYKTQGKMSILEIPVAGQLLGMPLAGAWLSRLPHWIYKLLFLIHKPKFITVSMHPWDAIDFEGRTSKPEDFLNGLENVLKVLKKNGYQFLSGQQILEKYGKLSQNR